MWMPCEPESSPTNRTMHHQCLPVQKTKLAHPQPRLTTRNTIRNTHRPCHHGEVVLTPMLHVHHIVHNVGTAKSARVVRSQLAVVQTVPEDDTALALTSVAVPLSARDAQTLRGLVWWLTRLNSAHGPLSLYTSARNERTVRMGC